MPTTGSDAFQMVLGKSTNARPTVEKAAHDIGPVGVAVPETHKHVVANLGDEHEAAVRRHALAAAAVGRHHAYPTRTHVARLPIHLDLDTTLAVGIGVADDPSDLSLGNRPAHVAHRKATGDRRYRTEAVAVEAVVADIVRDVDDQELTHRGVGHAADALAERTGELDHAPHRQPDALGGTLHVMRLGRLRLLLLLHVKLHLLHVVDAGVGVLQRGFPEQFHRGAESLVAELVKALGLVRRGLGHAMVVLRDVREYLGGTGKRLNPSLEADKVPLKYEFVLDIEVFGGVSHTVGGVFFASLSFFTFFAIFPVHHVVWIVRIVF